MKEERELKRKQRKIKFWIKFGIFVFILGMIVFFLKAPIFNVKYFEVYGNNYYTKDEIQIMGNCKTGGNLFIGTDLKDIQKRLEKDAYMKEVKVSRKFPNKVIIELDERLQIGAIVYGEKFVVIDGNGLVLRITSVEPKLTIIKGLTISKLSIGEIVETEEKVFLKQTLKILKIMQNGDMYFKCLELSKGEMKAYILDNLVCQGTANHIMESIKQKNLQPVVDELFKRKISRGTIKVSGDGYISFTPKLDT